MKPIICEHCFSSNFIEKYHENAFYVCSECHQIHGYYCNKCGTWYYSSQLGLHGDVYECKKCGKIQWGYTDFKRDNVYEEVWTEDENNK